MRLVFFAAVAALLLGATAARADTLIETFDGGPALDGILTPGTDGPWTLSIAGGNAVLENGSEPGAIKFYRIDSLRGGASLDGAAVAVDVGGDFPGETSGAGLLYRFDADSRSYLAFVLGADRWTLYQRGNEGVRARVAGKLPAGGTGPRRLRIQPTDDKLVLEIDGQQLASIQLSGMDGHGVGLVAIGTGRFDFDNFAVVPAGS
ncbi:hypothetical protein [Geminicoccus roseus]|uniref:hypothetical protein n=1 Tax=Geminicoccus roseus TaxID=404900 RepID=UPI000416F842|nr:hypothetical protein [Geminicoccus roseus]